MLNNISTCNIYIQILYYTYYIQTTGVLTHHQIYGTLSCNTGTNKLICIELNCTETKISNYYIMPELSNYHYVLYVYTYSYLYFKSQHFIYY